MKMKKKRPFSVYMLIILLVFQSLGGLFGGLSLVHSPSGEIMQMPLSMLSGSPFNNFLVPGLVLLLILGIFPGFLSFALIRLPDWRWADCLNIYKGIHWAMKISPVR